MIVLLAVALQIQSVSLSTDRRVAATTCIAVLSAQDMPADLDWFLAAHYLGLVAASNEQDVLAGMVQATRASQAERRVVARDRPGLLKACRARFPLAWSGSATLPQGAFERRFLCSVMAGGYEGLLDTVAKAIDVSKERSRVRVKSAHFGALSSNADAAAHGFDNQTKLYVAVQNV
ncbi:MAG TPA: hypothetical protein VN029_12205, partial [Sphingomonas sp.]|nr:hypothetical protein [Sphingomonas sp.]